MVGIYKDKSINCYNNIPSIFKTISSCLITDILGIGYRLPFMEWVVHRGSAPVVDCTVGGSISFSFPLKLKLQSLPLFSSWTCAWLFSCCVCVSIRYPIVCPAPWSWIRMWMWLLARKTEKLRCCSQTQTHLIDFIVLFSHWGIENAHKNAHTMKTMMRLMVLGLRLGRGLTCGLALQWTMASTHLWPVRIPLLLRVYIYSRAKETWCLF